ncbi:MAG: cardiolipin synthase [Synergistaceae bacterium]|jgi:cardiolipin synthase|nr:cardiolipin synthase [Synergistaceae bacterium]
MRHRESLWKKFLTVALFAFALGLLPYFWRAGFVGTREAATGGYGGVASYAKAMSRYIPHLLTAYVACIAALVFMEGRNPDRTILWLMTLVFIPVIGIVLYILLGPDFKRMKMRRMFRPTRSHPRSETLAWRQASDRVRKAATLAFRSSNAHLCERNEVGLLVDGTEAFGAIKRELERAKRYINIEYYIFRDDALGQEIARILRERSAAGVRVRMLLDGVGSWKLGRALIGAMQRDGVDVRTFMPVSFPFLRSRLNFRNHRKIIAIDGAVAFTGGLNVGLDYLGEGPLGHWRDTHAVFRGEAVRALDAVFLSDWEIVTGENPAPDDAESSDGCGGGAPLPVVPLQIVPSGGSAWRSIRQMYFMMITEAQWRIWITTPYLIPGDEILEALKIASLSGVDVRLLIPKTSDHFLSHWAGFSNVEDLLRAGVRIWLYEKGFVHAKTLVMDGEIASVGTANLDNRSLDINFEVQAFIYDEKICESMSEQFVKDLADSTECSLSEWEKRGVAHKILESVGRLWSSQV